MVYANKGKAPSWGLVPVLAGADEQFRECLPIVEEDHLLASLLTHGGTCCAGHPKVEKRQLFDVADLDELDAINSDDIKPKVRFFSQ